MKEAEGDGVDVAVVGEGLVSDAADGADVGVLVERGMMKGVEVSIVSVPCGFADVEVGVGADVVAASWRLRNSVSESESEAESETPVSTMARERPPKVTRAFSAVQERFAELKRARRMVPSRGMEKLLAAAAMRRGMASPVVTFERTPVRVDVVQPVVVAMEQVFPVKPLMQIQAQAPLFRNVLPPFWQAVVESAAHCCSGVSFVVAGLGLWMTRSSMGTTIAAAIITRRPKRRSRNAQQGIPQQRRLLRVVAVSFCESKPAVDGSPL